MPKIRSNDIKYISDFFKAFTCLEMGHGTVVYLVYSLCLAFYFFKFNLGFKMY